MNNFKLLVRDILKHIARKIEQVHYRLFNVQRSIGTSIAFDARLDIGKKLSFKTQPAFQNLIMKQTARIESAAVINTYHGDVVMKENSRVGIGSIIIGPVTIGENSGVSQYCFVTGENRKHSFDRNGLLPATSEVISAPVVIGAGCWIGAGVTILPGVEIGDCSVIAAGSVVTKSIPPFSIAAGIPAKVIKQNTENSALPVEEQV